MIEMDLLTADESAFASMFMFLSNEFCLHEQALEERMNASPSLLVRCTPKHQNTQ